MTKFTVAVLFWMLTTACQSSAYFADASVPDAAEKHDASVSSSPRTPAETIECLRDDGYLTRTTDTTVTKWWTYRATAGRSVPHGVAWLCYEGAPPSDCRTLDPPCEMVGEVEFVLCTQATWAISQQGTYYVQCGQRTEIDYENDGTLDVVVDYSASHVALVE